MNRKQGFFKRNLTLIIAILLLCDVGFSLYQYTHQAMDGDMSLIVLPGKIYSKVLQDPFGFSVITGGESYAGTNRYFAHATISVYCKAMPVFLQLFTTPIDSIYLSSGIMKTFIHFFLVYLLGVYISGRLNLGNRKLLIAMLLVTPLFHNWGSGMYMGFVDYSLIYAMAYALPMGFVMLFFLPFWLETYHARKGVFKTRVTIALALLGVYIAFNGALGPVVLALLSAGVFLASWWQKFRKMSGASVLNIFKAWGRLGPEKSMLLPFIILICGYSFFLGTFNAEHNWWPVSLAERYALLPRGLMGLVTGNTGVPLLIIGLIINLTILTRQKTDKQTRDRYITSLSVIIIAGLAYLCLLPFGGYREYRPFIIRQDTAMPFLLGLVLWYGMSAYYLLHTLKKNKFTWYLLGVIAFLLIFISNDPAHYGHYKCERKSLEMLAASEERVVKLPADCPILGWGVMGDTIATAKNVRMLRYWNVIGDDKTYYQSTDITFR